jgi:hypothetical protein
VVSSFICAYLHFTYTCAQKCRTPCLLRIFRTRGQFEMGPGRLLCECRQRYAKPLPYAPFCRRARLLPLFKPSIVLTRALSIIALSFSLHLEPSATATTTASTSSSTTPSTAPSVTTAATSFRLFPGLVLGLRRVVNQQCVERQRIWEDDVTDCRTAHGHGVKGYGVSVLGCVFDGS